ncbi:MAG: FkbM family methyltransferase [Methylophilus methylotrophus]|uniref:FkbM family methyltransferase n=1 Tax=Methylophilus methylotrophus TaxID=17 RepID=A0A5C7WNA8_METME|nr:MAG: FkbM family methyltransferase [Methylophilus methylotrophus]
MSATVQAFTHIIDQAWQAVFKRQLSQAIQFAQQAANIAPESAEVTHLLGVIASRDGRADLALPLLQKALNTEITERRLRDMAEALVLAKQPQAALTAIQQGISQFGENAASLGLLAAIHTALEDFEAASNAANKAIYLQPESLHWQTTLSFCDLIQGHLTSGLPAFTFRDQTLVEHGRCPALHVMKTPGELWLKNEQGPGDTLFFLCHARKMVEMGWKLHVQTHAKMQKILQSTGLFASVEIAFTCPPHGLWINIGDLPLAAMQIGLPPLAPPLTLKADPKLCTKIEKILHKFGPPPYIAVTWRGGVQGKKIRAGTRMGDRYIDSFSLGKTLSSIKATIISVQRLPDKQECKAFEKGLGRPYLDLSRLNDNLPEMLALMSILDDYIGVPNTNHHLREALVKPSRMVINRPYEDWRWGIDGNAQWYPMATCYRQSNEGDLTDVFEQITKDLAGLYLRTQHSTVAEVDVPKQSSAEQNLTSEMPTTEIDTWLAEGWQAVNKNDIQTAISQAQKALAASPESPQAYHLLGWAAMRDLKLDLAIHLLQKACSLAPNDGRVIGDLVRALTANNLPENAISIATDALTKESTRNRSSIYYGRAACYLNQNQLVEAIADYQQCMQINPNRLDAQEYCGMARLKLGEARLGFREYSARKVAQRPELLNDWCCPVLTPQHKDSRILIKRDMGLGDELTYLRYLPWLTQAGIQVDYWCGKKLKPLLERMGYLRHVFSDSNPPPASDEYDLSFIINDLPVAVEQLGAPEIAPPLPLTPRIDLVEKWQAWLESKGPAPYIGINWKAGVGTQGSGNIFSKLAKAVEVTPFAKALSQVEGTFISLQRNVLSDELKQVEQILGAPLHDVTALTDDLEDLLALLSLLDENIGVSNTNMHLRASLDKGSRVMVQTANGDWRWGLQGNQSVWFTNSIVYRQADNGSWEEALQQLQHDLKTIYATRQPMPSKVVKNTELPTLITNSKRLIWLSAGAIKHVDGRYTSELASTRYRVIAPAQALTEHGWHSEFVTEELSQVMGGWGSSVPQAGDTLIVSKVFTEHALSLAKDAKNRGAKVVVDFCDNLFDHPQRGPLQQALLRIADTVVAATEGMAYAINKHSRRVDAVISDPVEFEFRQPSFSPKKHLQLLWFGHAVNLDTVKAFLPALEGYSKKQRLLLNLVTSLPNGEQDLSKLLPEHSTLNVAYIPWSIEATQQAIKQADLVLIPVLSSQFKSAKSPNRLLEPLQSGRMVVAGPLPAYLPFADSAWIGENLIEGIEWCLSHPQEVLARIQQGQADIASHFTPQAIALEWNNLLSGNKSVVNPDRVQLNQPPSTLESYFQVQEAARILNINNQSETLIKQNYFNHYPVKYTNPTGKVAVYTAIFGGYDTAPILNYIDPQLDYILYTDQPDFAAPSPWQVRVVPAVFVDPQMDARRIKVLSHLFLADYTITVWIDGNFTLEKLTLELVQDIASRAPVSLCKHQFRNCIYDEAIEILKRGIDASTPVLKQIQYYQAHAFPRQYGLHATSFLVRNQIDPHTIKMNMRWWEVLATNSKRDQLSFDFVRWEQNAPVMTLPWNLRENTLYFWGKSGERKHQVDVRRNDEHEGRALNYQTTPVSTPHAYQPTFDQWHALFVRELNALNQVLLNETGSVNPSVLYTHTTTSPQTLPDPRLGIQQRNLLSKLCQAKSILQIGFDGGHLALMAIHHSGAKVVVVDEHLDEYKQAAVDYLIKQHPKRFATFRQQEIIQLDESVFDLVCVNSVESNRHQEIVQKLNNLSKKTVFATYIYTANPHHYDVKITDTPSKKSKQIDETSYAKSVYGVWLKNRSGDLTWKFAVQGKYGFYYSDWLKKQQASIFIDIGANIGLYSLIAGTNHNFKAIYSFEPHPDTYQYLTDNIKINQVNNCIPYKLAISHKSEKQTIHVKPNHSGVATLRDVKSSEGYQSSIEIECIDEIKLDTLIHNPNNLPITIKIDVEGFELVVLQTLIKTSFWRNVKSIYYEVDESYLDYKKVESLLLSEGFIFEAKNGSGEHYDLMFARK